MIGPWMGLDGKVYEATGKTFEREFCTVATRCSTATDSDMKNMFFGNGGIA